MKKVLYKFGRKASEKPLRKFVGKENSIKSTTTINVEANMHSSNNIGIWNVQNRTWNQLRLWRMDNDNFRVTEKGEFIPLLDNSNYTLINKAYASIFLPLAGQVIVTPVRIHDFVLKTENQEYVELKLSNRIDAKAIGVTDSSGYKVWSYNGHLFVSDAIRKQLEEVGGDELEFYLGFSMFA